MASGVKVNPACHELYNQVKMKTKEVKKKLFVVYKISDDCKEIIPDVEFDPHEAIQDFEQLMAALPAEDGRYVIYDYKYLAKAGVDNSKLILLSWVPEELPVKKKMLYASSKESLKHMLREDLPLFMCDRREDIDQQDIVKKLLK